MSDRLADALSEIVQPELPGDTWTDPESVAAWLRSPSGIAALAEDETIREAMWNAELERRALESGTVVVRKMTAEDEAKEQWWHD